MVFTRFVEVGRVAVINYGPDVNKLCTIIDVVDGKKVCILYLFVVVNVLLRYHRYLLMVLNQ